MIQIHAAHFHNFRLLRDVKVTFSRDPNKPLTVIRAENDTGKTTLLTGLTWALFGDKALPGDKRSSFRLHPIDWDRTQSSTVKTRVEVTFAAVDEESGEEVVYEIERSSSESLIDEDNYEVGPTNVALLRHTPQGVEPVDNTSAILESLLPSSLKDIFFIDGDRALAFIEATDLERVKRDRVGKAVRALLGLDLLDKASGHVQIVRQEIVGNIKKLGAGTEIERLLERYEKLESTKQELLDKESSILSDLEATDQRWRAARQNLDEALLAGAQNHKKLKYDLERSESNLESARKDEIEKYQRHRNLIGFSRMLFELAPKHIQTAAQILGDLESKKVIPNVLPTVIEDSLKSGFCICGTELSVGSKQRAVLERLHEETHQLDEPKERLRELNESAKRIFRSSSNDDSAIGSLRSSYSSILETKKRQTELESEVGDLRARIRGMGEFNLTELERTLAQEEKEKNRLRFEAGKNDQELKEVIKQLSSIERERTELERKVAKLTGERSKEAAAVDILGVLTATTEYLKGETIDQISDKMNEIFLSMIVADTDSGAVIRKAVLTRDNDIEVFGPGNRRLEPDTDLNGASRRALTLAFILALVEVSGYRAPNIIDTPLGMMGTEVRQAVVRYAATHASQLIMFLTGSEIVGVEDLLDQYAGESITFTNSAHFPTKLVNDPRTGRMETLVCRCNHRQRCELCKRRVGSLDFGDN
ncbi:AAA family ATPase [Acidithrix ferrooxidans]|uniref:Nuclease SbcCD subunit C n=1 Tax=Acidithrix ferrooxidans TaxID=1280514 RepID=A0A0D8HEC5_9ACTN|nr:AAA family ATPase [Acidithrix ferrooxidans]KJF16152.1 hypothetical protein AXFE_30000 [Acidithrix ferrooxidans]